VVSSSSGADAKKKFEAAADKAKACWEEMQPAE